MRTSKLLLGAFAVVAGLLIGVGGAKEVKAVDIPTTITINVAGGSEVSASQITGNGNYNNGNCHVLFKITNGESANLVLNTDLKVKTMQATDDQHSGKDLIITGNGKLTVDCSDISGTEAMGAIACSNLTIKDCAVAAIGSSNAINCTGAVTVTNASVTASGGGEYGCGINCDGLTVTDASVTATGGTGAHGVFSYPEPIKISGASTVVKASSGGALAAILADGSRITISDPLKVVKPEGGGLSANGQYISNTAGASGYGDPATDVEIRSKEEETFNVTFDYDKEQGSAKADPESDVEKGKTVKLTATPADGCEFVEWTSSDVTIDNATSADKASFTMPGKNVTVKAVFKKKGDPDPEPSKKVVINSKEDLTLDEKFGMEYSLCDENGKNFKNVKISKFEISGDIPDGLEIVQATNDNGDCYQIKGTPTKAGTYKFTVTITFTSDEYPDGAEVVDNITIKVSEKRDRKHHVGPHHDDGDHEDNTPAAVVNPNSITCYYIVNGVIDPKALFGKQEQGPACKASFTASCPKGWTEAFSFSMSYEGANTTTLKNGTLQLYIPGQFQKAGRQYAVMAMDKYGVVHIYQDTDALPFVFTAPLNFEGYAFNLIYKD